MHFLTRQKDILTTDFSSIEEEIERRVRLGDAESFMYIVPTGAWARELITRIVEFAAPKAIRVPHVLSLQEFISRIHGSVRPYKRIISDSESSVLIELAMSELFTENKLTYYEEREGRGRSLPIPKGTFEKLSTALISLKRRGISPKRLHEDVERVEKESYRTTELRRAKDLHSIYERYEVKLGKTLTDTYGTHHDIIEYLSLPASEHSPLQIDQITEFFRRSFPNVSDIFVGTFIDMDEPARLILNAMSHATDVNIFFRVEDAAINTTLFHSQQEFITKQSEDGFREVEVRRTELHENAIGFPKLLPEITKRLFLYQNRRKDSVKIEAEKCVHHFTARDTRSEVTLIARKIKEIVTNSPVQLSRMCVAMHRQDDYATTIEEIFSDYGIPVQLTERKSLTSSPLFTAIESLFRLAEFKLTRRELLRLLHSPYLAIKNDLDKPIDALNLADVISALRLPGGAKTWITQITQERARIESDLANRSIDDEFEERNLTTLLAKIKIAEVDIVAIERLIARFIAKRKPSNFLATLKDIIKGFGVREQLLSSDEAMLGAGALEADTRSYKALAEVLEEVERLILSLGLRDEELPLEFYTERIRVAALQKRFAPRVEPGQGVVITSFDQTAGYTFDHLFLIGLNDGSFPELYEPSIFAMREHQRSERENLASQRYQFFQTLASCNDQLYLSWLAGNSQNMERAPSTFVEALTDIVKSEEITEALTSSTVIYSSQELLRHIGASLYESNVLTLPEGVILSEEDHTLIHTVIPRAVAVEHERMDTERSSFGGYINVALLPEEMQERFASYRDRVYSASQLESYAKCPFQYFSRYVLRLGERAAIDEEEGLNAMESGNLLHERLHHMLETIRDEGKDLRGMDYTEFRNYDPFYNKYEELAERKPAARHPFWRADMEAMLDPEGGLSVFEKFLAAEQKQGKTTKPLFFEQEFKAHEIVEAGVDDETRTFRLRGKIDRIDVDEDAGIYAIVDYKLRNTPSMNDIVAGKSLQLPLYLRVADDLLRQKLGVEGVAALYQTLLGEKSEKKAALVIEEFSEKVFEAKGQKKNGFIKSAEELREVIEQTVRYANSYIDGITHGEFPLVKETERDVCAYCPYHNACRVESAQRAGVLRR